jgi:hypothetical protein
VRRIRLDFSVLTSAFQRDAASNAGTPGGNGELGTEVVEGNQVAGVSMPTDGASGAATRDAATGSPAAEEPVRPPPLGGTEQLRVTPPPLGGTEQPPAVPAAANDGAAAASEPPAPPAPEPPPGPEEFGFGTRTANVSEADPSAAVLVLRDGDRRRVSFITWWTTDGTAKAGSDFARLDRRTERFAAGEQNRTIRVPIIGDRNVEGPENFFVHIAAGENSTAEAVAEIEVIIEDDD